MSFEILNKGITGKPSKSRNNCTYFVLVIFSIANLLRRVQIKASENFGVDS